MANASEYRVKADGTIVMSMDVFRAIPADRVVNLLSVTGTAKAKRKERIAVSRKDVRIDVMLGA